MTQPTPSVTVKIVVCRDGPLFRVIGPPVQHLSTMIEMRIPRGQIHSMYEISGSFFPAMPHALNGETGLNQWLESLRSQGLDVRPTSIDA